MSEYYGERENPYKAPDDLSTSQQPPGTINRPPAGLKAIAILAIILGALGLVGACLGMVSTALQGYIQELQAQGQDEEFQEFQEEMADVQNKYAIAYWVRYIVHIPLAIALLVGGVKVLKRDPSGRSLLVFAAGCALLFEVARFTLDVVVQYELAQIMSENVADLPGPGGQEAAMGMKVGMLFGFACMLVWLLPKLVYYVITLIHLRKQHIKEYFEPGDSDFGKPFDPGFSQ